MTFYRNNKVIVGVVIYSNILIAEVCIYHLTSILYAQFFEQRCIMGNIRAACYYS